MKTHLKKIGASLLGAIIVTSTLSYAGIYGGYIYAPNGATLGKGTHVQDVQINSHTIRVYCQGQQGTCWQIVGNDLKTGGDVGVINPNPGPIVELAEIDISNVP